MKNIMEIFPIKSSQIVQKDPLSHKLHNTVQSILPLDGEKYSFVDSESLR